MAQKDLIDFIYICLFAFGGIAAACAPILISVLVRPRRKISKATLQTYECGNIPFGQSWDFRHGIGFYLYALMFLAFEVDVLYLYPVATVFQRSRRFGALLCFSYFSAFLPWGLSMPGKKVSFYGRAKKRYIRP